MTAEELRKCLENHVKDGSITKEQMENMIRHVELIKSGKISIEKKRTDRSVRFYFIATAFPSNS